eukprot:TRINITY_DN20898_c0_g1_i10.p2 TRINITY_DN20898_c0_g1~~TRINITY_DN20898_c0_g1_i10.p2  ORF type:complete len:140 (-),score=17.71 TRINITY_DN20898_c0_g1_i10:191-610(-)
MQNPDNSAQGISLHLHWRLCGSIRLQCLQNPGRLRDVLQRHCLVILRPSVCRRAPPVARHAELIRPQLVRDLLALQHQRQDAARQDQLPLTGRLPAHEHLTSSPERLSQELLLPDGERLLHEPCLFSSWDVAICEPDCV